MRKIAFWIFQKAVLNGAGIGQFADFLIDELRKHIDFNLLTSPASQAIR